MVNDHHSSEESNIQNESSVSSSKCDDEHLESATGGILPFLVAAGYAATVISDSVRESSSVNKLEAKLEKDRALAETNRSLKENLKLRSDLQDQISQLTPEQQKTFHDQA